MAHAPCTVPCLALLLRAAVAVCLANSIPQNLTRSVVANGGKYLCENEHPNLKGSGMTIIDPDNEDMSAEAVIARAIARRGEIFDEFRLLARESPRTYDLISKTAGYMHHYTGEAGAAQKLSGTMREL